MKWPFKNYEQLEIDRLRNELVDRDMERFELLLHNDAEINRYSQINNSSLSKFDSLLRLIIKLETRMGKLESQLNDLRKNK